jgi:hypothetical protein
MKFKKISGFMPLLRDLQFILIIIYLPDFLFSKLYKFKIFGKIRAKNYETPKFYQAKKIIKSLPSNSQELLSLSKENYKNFVNKKITKNSDSLLLNNLINFRKDYVSTIFVPDGWFESHSVNSQLWGMQLKFLKKGLERCGYEVSVVQLNSHTAKNSILENCILKSDLVIIYSISVLKDYFHLFNEIVSIKNLKDKNLKILGVITASPNNELLSIYKKWSTIIDGVVYYEESSIFKHALEETFKVHHFPLIQLPDEIEFNNKFKPTIHFSGLLKQNRRAWLIVLRYICILLKTNCTIWPISDIVTNNLRRTSYKPANEFAQIVQNHGFGFVMVHRSPSSDAHLIGSFFSYYTLGTIPIVQMQDLKNFSSDLVPYVDYFPIQTDLELATVLKCGIDNPEYFEILRKRIIHRIQTDFSPETSVKKLLHNLI